MTLTRTLCASTALVALGAVAITQPVAAEEITTGAFELPPVVSTASRLSAGLNSSSVTVIGKDKINRHPGKSLPDILAAEAGLTVRDSFGNGNETAAVDIRGFGEQAGQNVLVLVDGRRINDLDLGGVQFGLVPRENIQRIEVLRGSAAAVLYGEGGVGGAINIITQGGEKTQGVSATGTLGSFGYRRAQSIFQWGGKPAHVALSADTTESDGYRHNNGLTRHIYSAAVSVDRDTTDYRLSATYSTKENGLPGNRIVNTATGVNLVQSNPRGAQTPESKAEERRFRIEAGVETKLSDTVNLVVDASYRRRTVSSDFVSGFGTTLDDRSIATTSFTPRVIYNGEAGGHDVNVIGGIDVSYSSADVQQRSPFVTSDQDGKLTTVALYGQGDIAVTEALTFDAGVRGIFSKVDVRSPQNTDARSKDNDFNVAANVGAAYDVTDSVKLFARAGHAVRLATIDERVGTRRAGAPTFAIISFDLKNQTSWDFEVGTEFGAGPVDVRVSAFQINVENQIAFTPDTIATFGFNTNLDDTRRRGVEAEAVAELGYGFEVKPRVAYTQAVFTKGPFDGNKVPLVPEWTGGLGIDWTGDNVWASANWRYVDSQRMINDQQEIFPEIPSYDLLDISVGGTIGMVSLKGEVRNVLDEDYFATAAASDTNPNVFGAFPLPGRAAYVEASVAF